MSKQITDEQMNKLAEYFRNDIIPERLACVRDAVMKVLEILDIEVVLK